MAGTIWNTYVAGRKIKASEVNANFDWIEGSLLPMVGGVATDNTYDLGTTTAAWRHSYIKGNMYLNAYGASSYLYSPNTTTVRAIVNGGNSLDMRSDGISIDATKIIYVDGGGDTYIQEDAANRIKFTAGGVNHFFVGINGDGCCILPTKKLYLDGGGDTYIYEYAANYMAFVTGGNEYMYINSVGNVGILENFRIESGKILYLDGGSNTYIKEGSADILQFYCGGNKVLQLATNDNCAIYTSNLLIDTNKAIYFDGGSNTYMKESTADTIEIVCGGSTITTYNPTAGQTFAVNITLNGTNKLAFGSTSVYISGAATASTILLTAAHVQVSNALHADITYQKYARFLNAPTGTSYDHQIYQVDPRNLQFDVAVNTTTTKTMYMGTIGLYPSGDGQCNLGQGSTLDWNNVYYHSLNAHCFDTVKRDITNSIPALLFETLPKTGRYHSHVQKASEPKKYGFYIEEKDTDARPYINIGSDGNKSISLHGLIAQLTECVKDLNERVALLEKT